MVIGSTGDWIPARALLGPNDELERLRTVSRALSHQNPSFPRKNVTPAASKPGRESRPCCEAKNWIPARALLGPNDHDVLQQH
jgi:hypothetical protein